MLPAFLEGMDPDRLHSDNYVVVDFETDTSHGDYGAPVHPDNQLLLACYRLGPGHPFREVWGDIGTVASWGNEFEQSSLVDLIQQADYVVAHNAKYELGWLRRCGLDLHTVLAADTKLAEYVLLGNLAAGDERMRPLSTSLDSCCIRRGMPAKDPVVDVLIKNGINPVRLPRDWLEGRCRQDVETTEQLWLDQRAHLARTGRLPVFYTRCILTPMLADIEFEGMGLDPERVEAEYDTHVKQLAELDAQMRAMTGGINWRSSKQAAEFLYDKLGFQELRRPSGEPRRTAKGARLTDQKTLDKLEAKTDQQREYLALRKKIGKVAAALSKNLEFFLGVVRERGGTFHAVFNQDKTATHRLSSSGIPQLFQLFGVEVGKRKKRIENKTRAVQFQNMPRKFKSLLRAKRPGWKIGEADGSSLEFRIAVILGNDAQGKADIENPNWDAHCTSAATMNDMQPEDMFRLWKAGDKKAEGLRQEAKSETFKPLYGGKKGTKKQEKWYRGFRERYKGIAATQEEWIKQVLLHKRLRTPWGLYYFWPYAKRDNGGYVNVETAVCNYPVQALATAEIIPVAIVMFWHRVNGEGLADKIIPVNTVHDSLVCEIAPGAEADFERLAKWAFTTAVYDYLDRVYGLRFDVPLGCGIKVGSHWGTGEEKAFNVYRDGREVRVK